MTQVCRYCNKELGGKTVWFIEGEYVSACDECSHKCIKTIPCDFPFKRDDEFEKSMREKYLN